MNDVPAARCPWCSAVLPAAGAQTCPSCGAHLVEPAGVSVPGVTAIDAAAIVRSNTTARSAGGIVDTLTGGIVDTLTGGETEAPTDAELPALAPPDEEVRREMLRMELEAELADLTAEAHAIAAERGIPLEALEEEAAERDRQGSGGGTQAP